MFRVVYLLVLTCVGFAIAVPAVSQDAATAPAPSVEEFRVTDLTGNAHSGRLLSVAPEIILVDDHGEHPFGWADVLELRPPPGGASRPAPPTGWRVELADGSMIYGRIEGDRDDQILVGVASGDETQISLAGARSLVLVDSGEPVRTVLRDLVTQPDAVDDAVILMKGDEPVVLRGNVTRWSSSVIQFRWKDRELPIPWEKLAAVVLGRPPPAEQSTTVLLRSGARLAGRVIGGDAREVVLDSPSLGKRTIGWPLIERIEARSGRVAFLSDIPPRLYEFTPFLEHRWEPAFDRTLLGAPIVLGGKEYEKGISMHSQSRMIYAINRAARQFAAVVGISDEMGPRGAVDLSVIGDGQILWEARGVRGGEPPREMLVDVSSVEVLELRVDFGGDLDLSDQVCWAFARLIR